MRKKRQTIEASRAAGIPRGVPASFRRALRAGELIDGHHHDQGQLVYPARGLMAVTTIRGTWMAPPHRAVWVPAYVEHQHRAWGVTDMRAILLSESKRRGLETPVAVIVSPLLRELILALTSDASTSSAERARMESVVLDQLTTSDEQPLHLPDASDDRLRATLAILESDPSDQLTIAELGRRVGASERTLSRLFRSELGMTFPQWRTQLRVHRSLMLLADGQSVTRAAADTGWTTTSAFIAAFSHIVGITPGRYLAEVRRR